jgi:EAL domain-containing protein (putative c-di-GMP-specific phosphodiesterase class I)
MDSQTVMAPAAYRYNLRTGTNVWMNRRAQDFFGYRQSELHNFGDNLLDELVHQDDVAIAVEHLTATRGLSEGDTLCYLLRIWPRDGLHPKFARICHTCVEVEGGECVEIEGYVTEITVAEFDIRKLLERAIPRKEILLHYQPICDLATGDVRGYEGLARLQRGPNLYGPGHFLPYLDGPLEHVWVAQQVDDIMSVLELLPNPLTVSMNACQSVLETEILLELLDLHPRGDLAGRFCLEVLESTSLANPIILKNLHGLKWLGVALKADDVGAEGHGGGLDRLLTHGLFKYVKFDGHLIRGILHDTHLASVVRHLLEICQDEGLTTVAEWVETVEQRDWLLEHGCKMGQGRLFGMAKPPEDIP